MELVVALAIIFLLVAIALPHLLAARDRANEVCAISSLNAIHIAQSIYQNSYPANGYSSSLVNLGNNGSTCETATSTNACLIDSALASGTKDAYLFDLLGDGGDPDRSYTLKATPISASSGDCAFYTDQSGVIQYGSGPPVSAFSAGGTPAGGARCSGNVN